MPCVEQGGTASTLQLGSRWHLHSACCSCSPRGLHPSHVSPPADPSCRRLKEVNAKCPQQLKAYYECMDYYR